MKKLTFFIFLFTLMNLALIPLISLYGLSICPFLKVPGFLFGCAYAGSYIFSVLLINYLTLFYLIKTKMRSLPPFFKKHPTSIYISNYLISSVVGLIVLQWIFNLNHMSGGSRAPEILAFASTVLGMTQAYGLNWAIGGYGQITEKKSFNSSWLEHSIRTMAPVFTGILLLIHYLLIQSQLQTRNDPIRATTSEIIEQTNYIILFVIAWMLMTYLFHFLSERENAMKVNHHLNQLEAGQYHHSSSKEGSWGLWASLIYHLNNFSRVFKERTSLLKSFSRFVTDEVAQQALVSEITDVSGKEEELTVIMTDIRDFTRLSQERKPDVVVKVLNAYFTVMLDELAKHGIIVDKFIGDGILAYVENTDGLSPDEQNQNAVKAALGMLERLKDLNKEFANEGLPELKIGVGVYRGFLIKGYIGSINKLQHTIIGDTVNRAARLESLCKVLEVPVVITEGVWQNLKKTEQKQFKLFENVQIKGISETMNVFGLN